MELDERDGALLSRETHPLPSPRSSSDTRQRKSRKVTRACDACKSKKKACTGTIPCGPCVCRKVSCTYDTTYHRGVAVTPHPSNTRLRRDSATPADQRTAHGTESVSNTPDALSDRRASADVVDQYWGPTSAHSFLGRVVRGIPSTPGHVEAGVHEPDPVPKASIFHYGDRVAPEVQLSDFEWPDRFEAESLTRCYFEFACPTYRTLHQPTIEDMVSELYGEDGRQKSVPRESAADYAILLMVFSTATMFRSGADGRITDADDAGWRTSELYFVKAEQLLSQESGAPRLESAQVRFLMVLYLLSSSRANKAWFTMGTAIQLMMALGLHSRRSRRDADGVDLVQRECRRRIIWCSYTLDKYLSVILGRPRLWHDRDVDEELPARVNDMDLLPTSIQAPKRDCVMDAPVFHALLARTLSRAAKEPYVVAGISSRDQLKTIEATVRNAPSWKYSAILRGLRRELERLGLQSPFAEGSNIRAESAGTRHMPLTQGNNVQHSDQNVDHGQNAGQPLEYPAAGPDGSFIPFAGVPRAADAYFVDPRTEYLFDSFMAGEDIMLDFWPQLDSLPITYMG